MANISSFVFFDEESTEQTSNYLANANGAGSITVQVDVEGNQAINLSAEGMNDLNKPDNYFPIKGVGLTDFKTYTNITSSGLYIFPLDGISRFRLVCNEGIGGFKAYGVAVG